MKVDAVTEDQIQYILKFRRMRSEIFGEGLFSDPAWDILLELLAAELGKRKVTLRDLAWIAPESTLARWIAALEERKLVEVERDRLRPDQSWIGLTRDCAADLSLLLSGAPHSARVQ